MLDIPGAVSPRPLINSFLTSFHNFRCDAPVTITARDDCTLNGEGTWVTAASTIALIWVSEMVDALVRS